MNFKKIFPLVIVLFLTLTYLVPSFNIRPASAVSTLTYQVSQQSDDCFKAWIGTGWIFWTNKMDDEAGYWNSGDYMEGGGMRFQSIAIPQGATITSAYLKFYVGPYGIDLTNPYCHNKIRGEDADNSVTFSTVADFDARIRTTAVVDWSYIESWYQNNWYNSPDVKAIVQEIVNRPSWVSGNNMTLFRDDFDDRSAHVEFTARECYAYERGASTAPKLVITYDTGTGDSGSYLYQLHGPYYETGEVYLGFVNVTVSFLQATPAQYVLNGTSGVAEDLDIYANETAISMFWNITSNYAYQRTYYFSNTTSNEVYVYVPDNNIMAASVYSISVIDFAGLTNAYVETTKNVGGYTRIIERRPLDVANAMYFWLVPFTQYNLRVTSNQGTWTFNLPADGATTKQFLITRDMITQTFTGTNVTVTATRLNATYINIYFADPLLQTENITTTIVHRNSASYIQDFSQVDTGVPTTNITWTLGAGDIDYTVNVTAYRHDGFSGYQTWTFSLPVSTVSVVQYWLGYFDLLGIFPIPSYQLPAMFFCLLFFSIGSWRDSDALSFMAIIICGLFQVIGWGSFPLAGIFTSIMVVIFMYLHRGKQETVMFE